MLETYRCKTARRWLPTQQDKLIALHDADCPWRPADLQQRLGRIVRQGNTNPEVEIYRYVTEQTFDAYLFQLVENKQKFIGQIMTSKSQARSAEDVDEAALSYSEIKALATGNPLIIEKSDLEVEVSNLCLLQSNYLSQQYELEDLVTNDYPKAIKSYENRIAGFEVDAQTVKANTPTDKEVFSPITIDGKVHTEKKTAGKALIEACKSQSNTSETQTIGKYRGLDMELSFDSFSKVYKVTLKGEISHTVKLGDDAYGNITRINNHLDGFEDTIKEYKEKLAHTRNQMEKATAELGKSFPQADELKEKMTRLNEVTALLSMDEKKDSALDNNNSHEIKDRNISQDDIKRLNDFNNSIEM